MRSYTSLISAGMGIGVSGHRLARAVSAGGRGWGTVSGTGIAHVIARELQIGDPTGDIRRALAHFPDRRMALSMIDRYFAEGGKVEGWPFGPVPMHGIDPAVSTVELTICANFVEVWLAKEGHDKPVGVNFLTKVALPLLPSLYGAMLAGVDYVAMGAGIPLKVPGVLDRLAGGLAVEYPLAVEGGAPGVLSFDPVHFVPEIASLHRPDFYPIVSSSTLAQMMIDKANGRVDGFIVEGPTAGGHNAPPRGRPARFDELGQPIYGERDEAEPADFVALGLPFWLAGGFASPDRLHRAIESGATGIQVGSAFALCEESGLDQTYKQELRRMGYNGTTRTVRTDPRVSPAGFPFKVVELEGSLSDPDVYRNRRRICDMGYLRTPYGRDDGSIGLRCPAEPIDDYVRKGGREEDAVGRACLCNALMSNLGRGQVRAEAYVEPPLITLGDDIAFLRALMADERGSFTAADVIVHLLQPAASAPAAHSPG